MSGVVTRNDLGSLLAAAERLTVDLIAQPLVTVAPSTDTPGYARHVAERENFDVIPIVEDDGRILRTVRRQVLDRHDDEKRWEQMDLDPIRADELVSSTTPLLEVLERISPQHPRLFVLGRRNIEGIATIYDLNQPAAHQLGFSLALVIEAALGRAIENAVRETTDELDIDVDDRLSRRVDALSGSEHGGIRRRAATWRRKVAKSEQIRLVQELVFHDKLVLIREMDLAKSLAAQCRHPYTDEPDLLLQSLGGEVRRLRNAIAHNGQLPDERAIWRWMLTTYQLAQDLGDHAT